MCFGNYFSWYFRYLASLVFSDFCEGARFNNGFLVDGTIAFKGRGSLFPFNEGIISNYPWAHIAF